MATKKRSAPDKREPQASSRRFTRQTERDGLVELDTDNTFGPKTIARHKATALAILRAAGIPATTILSENPGGSALRDYVINAAGHEPDSDPGLACRILELCIRIEVLPALGAPPSMLMGDAYRLGRLVAFSKAYSIEQQRISAMQREGADERRVYTDGDRETWCALFTTEYQGHTAARAAELIAQRLGLPERAEQSIRKALPKKRR
jgi:hypothetical protein